MKTPKMWNVLTAIMLVVSMAGCGPTYYSTNRYGYHRHHHPYGGYARPRRYDY